MTPNTYPWGLVLCGALNGTAGESLADATPAARANRPRYLDTTPEGRRPRGARWDSGV